MGQRSQIYVRYTNDKGEHFLTARYFGWNYGERMVSRARHTIEWIKDNIHYANFSLASDNKKLIRIIDTNFDMHDVMISTDIIEEYFEYLCPDYTFKDYVFINHDNNDGKLFIDVYSNGTIKYAFIDSECNLDKPMGGLGYMRWNHKNWRESQHISKNQKEKCNTNCKYLRNNFQLMTTKELKDFISCDYNVENYMPKF
jgi:hypothetical protein